MDERSIRNRRQKRQYRARKRKERAEQERLAAEIAAKEEVSEAKRRRGIFG
jgi:hypothetical protein